jgi:hypothetical protein
MDYLKAADVFYEVLRENIPDFDRLFKDEVRQKTMFIVALESIEEMSRGEGHVSDYMQVLGQLHASRGLTEAHVRAGHEAFRKAIEIAASDATDEQKQKFLDSFALLTREMGFDV